MVLERGRGYTEGPPARRSRPRVFTLLKNWGVHPRRTGAFPLRVNGVFTSICEQGKTPSLRLGVCQLGALRADTIGFATNGNAKD